MQVRRDSVSCVLYTKAVARLPMRWLGFLVEFHNKALYRSAWDWWDAGDWVCRTASKRTCDNWQLNYCRNCVTSIPI